MLLNCPKPEKLLELFTIPGEISLRQRAVTKTHAFFCADCQQKLTHLKKSWEHYFKPEPDITSSLLKVYSRLQKDETLILKGWKFGEAPRKRGVGHFLFKEGWFFRGAVGLSMASLIAFVTVGPVGNRAQHHDEDGLVERYRSAQTDLPVVQIRQEDKDRVKVHYLQPELLQTIEFETTSAE
jgi:hypothetical protein